MKLNVLVFGPHPDDAEIGAGGLLLKMKDLGHKTGIVDMTRGDMGWGTPEERDRECAEAAKILQLDVRANLDLGDNRIEDTFENRCKVAATIRKYRPEILFAPYYDLPIGRGLGHNDHFKTGILVAQAFNLAHLAKAPVEGDPHQAKAVYYYFIPPGMRPTFTVDVSRYFDTWMAALACHKTQFHNPDKPKPTTAVPEVSEYIGTLSQTHGWPIGVRHAQSFLATSPLRIKDPMDLVREIQPRP
ncbi:MAG: bacillithiol biosynthesis deacetylase BshB1 [Candidatus Eisenbacteria bacterium]|uniref:Bacillithiol biosynthesis deacetylase BshB1 n=1 Tax=Eiseniibacteriota bacterium TaxID=2212470 RepID=A0A538T0L7_UNCEI|nr:MAG: bacillithiol biosynthesis deacetylase BshB1 [Candidatus Eisenbacteria bacterium]